MMPCCAAKPAAQQKSQELSSVRPKLDPLLAMVVEMEEIPRLAQQEQDQALILMTMKTMILIPLGDLLVVHPAAHPGDPRTTALTVETENHLVHLRISKSVSSRHSSDWYDLPRWLQ